MYDLVVCGIAAGEEAYLAEWLSFGLLQGVQHFYLNINNPIDRTPEILEHYKDVVTLGTLPLNKEDEYAIHQWQLRAYAELADMAKKKSRWITILDCDEYLWSPTGKQLPEVLKDYNDKGLGCIQVRWAMFGDSGHRTKTDGLVIERFTHRQDGTHPHCKSVFKSSHYKEQGGNCHTVRVKVLIVNERKVPQPKEYAVDWKPGTFDILRINHYHIKSFEEAMARLALREGKATEVKDKEHFYAVDNYNDIKDESLLKFAPAIKENIRKRGL